MSAETGQASPTILFIINPQAGAGKGKRLPRLIDAKLGNSVPYEIFLSKSQRALHEALPALLALESLQRVVVAGGDGTLMTLLPILSAHPHLTVALLPLGTGNLLAQNLHLPTQLEAALNVALYGQVKHLDIGQINAHYFLLNAGVGIDASIMAATRRSHKKRWGALAYLVEGARQFLMTRRAKIRITADGKVMHSTAIGVLCFNVGSELGGGLKVTQNVTPDDGWLHGSILRIEGPLEFFVGLFQVLLRQHGQRRDAVHHFKAKEILIESRPNLKAQADGNLIGETPVTIKLLEQKLRFIVPQER
jgi:diacylglycerol kinase (ATP)